jgi:hypothetical protein
MKLVHRSEDPVHQISLSGSGIMPNYAMGENPIEKQIERRKWKWVGHTLRKKGDAIERRKKKKRDWNSQVACRRKRPRGTWRRGVLNEAEDCGKTWKEVNALAKNRD